MVNLNVGICGVACAFAMGCTSCTTLNEKLDNLADLSNVEIHCDIDIPADPSCPLDEEHDEPVRVDDLSIFDGPEGPR